MTRIQEATEEWSGNGKHLPSGKGESTPVDGACACCKEIIAAFAEFTGETPPTTNTQRRVDIINHPSHYLQHSSGVECIQITEHMNFNRGNAVKYIWRAGKKGSEVEDLQKAKWYIEREIARLQK